MEKNYRRRGARYRARRRAVDFLFEAETRDVDPVAIVEDRIALSRFQENGVAPVADYTSELVRGAAERLDEIDAAIERYLSQEWELRRLPAVDRAVLRVGAWEILFNPEIDAPISIVDSVEIAAEYSTDVASPYIHAVLDDIAQSSSADNPLNEAPDPGIEGGAGAAEDRQET
ncbi:transcription antitermination factor NusB [Corynebacterium guangdongense]|uniref:transcription antitermination factor NusB n=1 Tax=Corynebacterium guangdongense TaxID=1783348 RepID=UPI0025B2E785|nr:transcription antitermination factor NusB [Corynebacterium guangdongense]